jgi:hypothetical protein
MEELKSSLDLAKETGRDHSNLLAAIRRLEKLDKAKHKIVKDTYWTKRQKPQKATYYRITEETWNTITSKVTRWTIPLIDKYIDEYKLPIKRLSEVYSPEEMKWQCTIDGYIWDIAWTYIKTGSSNCSRCSQQEHWSQKRILEKLAHPFYASIQLLSKEYVDCYIPIHCKCATCNYVWKPLWTNMFHRKQLCPRCSNTLNMSKELLMYRLTEQAYSNWQCTTIPYDVTAISTVRFTCKKCGFNRDISWNVLSCYPICSCCHPPNNAPYTIPTAEHKKKEWLLSKATVYFITLFNSQERFKKIGITSGKVTYRFSGQNLPYSYTVVKKIETNKYNATYIENALHELHKEYKYEPKKYFAGYTECFTQLVPYTQKELDKKVQELKDEYKEKQKIKKEGLT